MTVSVAVTGDGKNAYWQFDMTVKIRSVNSRLTVSSQQTFSDQRLSGTSEPFTWTRDVVFTVTGKTGGSDTIRAEASMDADHQSPTVAHTMDAAVSVLNQAPVLSSGSVAPASGSESTPFAYEVTYSDPDGDTPSYVRAKIDGTSHEMTPKDGNPDTMKAGEIYSVDGINLAPGSHEYYFEASDGEETADLGASSPFQGPDVSDTNDPPTLTEPAVDPAGGSPGSTFTFSITYTDVNDDPPENGVILHIDGDATGIPMDLDMNAPSHRKDGDHTDGEDYIYSGILEEGDHQFSFSAGDGEFDVASGLHTGPSVSTSPILIASIISPQDAAGFLSDKEIGFAGEISSNVDITDARYLWDSNISGIIGEESEFSLMLPAGVHHITLSVYSVDFDLSDEVHITITVEDPAVYIPPFEIRRYLPSGDPVIDETEQTTFSVTYIVNRGDPVLSWSFNGDPVVNDADEWNYESFHDSSGVHEIELVIRDGDEDYEISHIWNLTVNDVPAPILIEGVVPEDLGEFDYGDQIEIAVNMIDPLGRDIIIVWKIDGTVIPQTGGSLSITAGASAETMAGNHLITILAQNPDGETAEFSIAFRVLEIVTNEDDDPDDDDDGGGTVGNDEGGDGGRKLDLGLGPLKKEWPGYLIMIFGIIATLAGIIYSVSVLLPERKDREFVYEETAPVYEESTALVLEEYTK